MKTYCVLKAGISQREKPGGELVDRAVGELIDVSDEAAVALLAQGYLEPVEPGEAPRRKSQGRGRS